MESFIDDFYEAWMNAMIDGDEYYTTPLHHNYTSQTNHFTGNFNRNAINTTSSTIRGNEIVTINTHVNSFHTARTSTGGNYTTIPSTNLMSTLFEFVMGEQFNVIPGQEFEEFEDVKVVLSQTEFDKLEHTHIQNTPTDNSCYICLEQQKPSEIVTKLPCKHMFHQSCIKSWLCNENVKCPVCRFDVREHKV